MSKKIKVPANTRRLNINLPESTFKILQDLSLQTQRSLTEIVRSSIGLVIVALREEAAGNKLAVMTQDEKLLKEIVMLR